MKTIDDALAKLTAWAKAGGTLETTPAADDADDRLTAPQPEFGELPSWQLPPSYRALLEKYSRVLIKWGESLGHEEFVILDPGEIAEVSGIVYLPEGVARDAGELSTNHLVPFASGGDDECAFCFDVTRPGKDGEYPVYFHHQDEPRARYVDGGAWEDPTNETPDFESFAEWLSWVADELSAGREPANSRPTSFDEMRSRKR